MGVIRFTNKSGGLSNAAVAAVETRVRKNLDQNSEGKIFLNEKVFRV